MLKIRNVLDQHGISFGYLTTEKKYEVICRSYVKENGFKLKWFNEIEDRFIGLSKIYLSDLNYAIEHYDEFDIKLIAWLYANDIEII